ncbi:hypothetical protein [Curtobacterium sp. AB7]|uniref:hypothetical protein n=1 Tax=Curtobacterium sp. AB7 TaxID=3349327 RepID=UPI003838E51E
MTSLIPARIAAAVNDPAPGILGVIARRPSRFDELTLQETYIELGATDAAVDAALARLAAIWSDAQALDADLDQVAAPRQQEIATDIDG